MSGDPFAILTKFGFARYEENQKTPDLSGPGVAVVCRETESERVGERWFEIIEAIDAKNNVRAVSASALKQKWPKSHASGALFVLMAEIPGLSDRQNAVLAINALRNADKK